MWEGGDNVLERLDRCLVSMNWLHQFPNAKIKHHIFTSLEHCFISLVCMSSLFSKAIPFKFEKMWCLRKDFDILVKITWCSHFNCSFMFRLVNKCKLLKINAKEWNKTRFGNVICQLSVVDTKLASIQNRIIIDRDNVNLQKLQDRFLEKSRKLFEFQEKFWYQQARTNNFIKDDVNSKYFHGCSTIRKNRSNITSFKEGNIISNPIQISKAISTEFKEIFISDSCCSFSSKIYFSLIINIISEDDNAFLCQAV